LHELVERQRFEDDLGQALDRGEFEVWYQPQIDLRTKLLAGVEALLRWRHPERGMVSPEAFVPVAEAIGLIDRIGEWVLETACAEVVGWPGSIRLAVNVSSAQFAQRDVAEIVARVLARTAMPPARLDLEITESLFMQPGKIVEATLARLRSFGVGIALDDFGTGYSSLGYIQKFPITKIKLDQSFVADLPENSGSAAIVRAVASLAKDLQLHLNAEGVENAAQVAFLSSLGVDEVQGYLFGRPQPASEIVHLLNQSAELVRLRA
jgi:EAL domain-containing protein (putative c-di-GMP-specific phosphodiesterase class I)